MINNLLNVFRNFLRQKTTRTDNNEIKVDTRNQIRPKVNNLAYWSRLNAQPMAKVPYEVVPAYKQCKAAEYRINSAAECLAAVRELQNQADPLALKWG